jgi:hypothetical protein
LSIDDLIAIDKVATPAIRAPLNCRVGYIIVDILRGRSVLVDIARII